MDITPEQIAAIYEGLMPIVQTVCGTISIVAIGYFFFR